MKPSRVGIGMPVYNGDRYIEKAIVANLKQSFNDFTLVISDNASTDKTEEICRAYAAQDKRIVYVKNPVNVGAAANYSKCYQPVSCEFFRWSNADDIPEPTLIEKCLKVLEADPSTVLVYGKSRIIDENGVLGEDCHDNLHLPQEKASDRFRACLENIGLNNVIYGLIRRETLNRTSFLKPYPGSDINFVAEISLYGKFFEIPEFLFQRRMHPKASSWDRKNTQVQMTFWDPNKKKPSAQYIHTFIELRRAILRAQLPIDQRLSLLYYLAKRAYWDKKMIVSDMKEGLHYFLAQNFSKPTIQF